MRASSQPPPPPPDSLRPPPFPQRHLLALSQSTPIHLGLPRPVLTQAHLRITSIVKVDLRNRRLDQRPDSPVEARHAAIDVDLGRQAVNLRVQIHLGSDGGWCEAEVASHVLGDELAALGARGQHAEVAVEPAPLGKVVGEVEGGGRGHGVLVVDEGDGGVGVGGAVGGGDAGVSGLALRQDDYVAGEEVAVGENELAEDVSLVVRTDLW